MDRRPATPGELARLEPAEPVVPVREGPAIHLMRPPAAASAESRRRGGERAREVYASRAASRPAQQPTAPPRDPAPAGAPAARPEAPRPVPVPVTTVTVEEDPVSAAATPPAPPAIPCGTCIHDRVCKLKARLDPDLKPETVEDLDDGLVVRWTVTVDCPEYHEVRPSTGGDLSRLLDGLEAPAPVRREHGGESWRTKAEPGAEATPIGTVRVTSIEELNARLAAAPKGRPRTREAPSQESRERGAAVSSALYAERRRAKDAQAIEQLREHGGNAEAVGRAMGVTGAAVKQWLARMEAAGELPADVAELVAARGRRKVQSEAVPA